MNIMYLSTVIFLLFIFFNLKFEILIIVMYLSYCCHAFIDCYIFILATKLPNCQTSRIQEIKYRGSIVGGSIVEGSICNSRGLNCRPLLVIRGDFGVSILKYVDP